MAILFQNWTFMRGLRLLLGVIVLIQSIIAKDLLMGGMASFLIAITVFNFGCCGANGCDINFNKNNSSNAIEDVDYEEVAGEK